MASTPWLRRCQNESNRARPGSGRPYPRWRSERPGGRAAPDRPAAARRRSENARVSRSWGVRTGSSARRAGRASVPARPRLRPRPSSRDRTQRRARRCRGHRARTRCGGQSLPAGARSRRPPARVRRPAVASPRRARLPRPLPFRPRSSARRTRARWPGMRPCRRAVAACRSSSSEATPPARGQSRAAADRAPR